MFVLLGCNAGPVVISAEEVGVVGQSATINGRDGGGSAALWGKSVWTYGDTTLTAEDEDGQTWHHNSVSWSDDVDPTDGLGGFVEPQDAVGAPAHLIPPTEEEFSFNEAHWDDGDCADPCGARWAVWPGTPVWDPQDARALLFYGLVYAEPGEFNFDGRGTSIATWTGLDEPVRRPTVDPEAEHPDLIWGEDEPGIGVAAAVEGGHLYAFACEAQGLGRPCTLARAALERVQERAAWSWYDGTAFGAGFADAAPLFDGAPIMSLSWNDHLDAWLVVYTPPLDGDVYGRTAAELTGPWSDATRLYATPEADAPYDGNEHPELSPDGGETVYVTYSRAHGDRWFATEFPLVEIRFASP